MLLSKYSTKFKRIKGFVPSSECAPETEKFKGAPKIKEEIDTVGKYLPSKVKKHGLNSNPPETKRKVNVR